MEYCIAFAEKLSRETKPVIIDREGIATQEVYDIWYIYPYHLGSEGKICNYDLEMG